ncbi:mis18-binding protein 1 [Engraulis encrasicolus]|uniref:mis18-binding protein 1 n=1 Tax=Engraulis encrasicolus TaxID=184585 RepID=UPI002FCFC049
MYLSPSKRNFYGNNAPPVYGRTPRQTPSRDVYTHGKDSAKPKVICHDGKRHPSVMPDRFLGTHVFNSTSRENTSPDISFGLSHISENGMGLSGDASVHPSISALRTAGNRQWESPVKIFARMKAKVSNTPTKNFAVREELPPSHGFVQSHRDLENMDIEQYPSSSDGREGITLTLSPPNSPESPLSSERNNAELNEEPHGIQCEINNIDPALPPSQILQNNPCVMLERLPVAQSPAKIFATLKKTPDPRPLKSCPVKQIQNSRGNGMALEPPMRMSVNQTYNIPNEDDRVCSDSSMLDSQSEGNSPAVMSKKPANGKPSFVPTRIYKPTEPECMDGDILCSPRLAIPQRRRTDDSDPHEDSEYLDPKTIDGIQLRDWYLKLSDDDKLFIDGRRDDLKIPWHSSVIVERIANNVLKTASGKLYVLIGKMCTRSTCGLPLAFRKKFLYGFPKTWQTHLQAYVKEHNSQRKKIKPEKAFVPTKRKPIPEPKLEKWTPLLSTVTPPASVPGSSQKVSRSGRILKSPMEYWKGARVSVDMDLNVTIYHDYSMAEGDPASTAGKGQSQKQNMKKARVTQKDHCPSPSSQEEGMMHLVRKARPYQRPGRIPFRDNKALSETRDESPFAIPHLPSRSVPTAPRNRSSQRSGSTSSPMEAHSRDAAKDKTSRLKSGRSKRSNSRSSSEDRLQQTGRKRSSPRLSSDHDKKRTKTVANVPVSRSTSETEEEVMGPPKTSRRRVQKNKALLNDVFSDREFLSVSETDQEVTGSSKTKKRGRPRKKTPTDALDVYSGREFLSVSETDQEVTGSSKTKNRGRPRKKTPTDALDVYSGREFLSPSETEQEVMGSSNATTKHRARKKAIRQSLSSSDSEQEAKAPPKTTKKRSAQKKTPRLDDGTAEFLRPLAKEEQAGSRRNSREKKGAKKEAREEPHGDDEWTAEELRKLDEAVSSLPTYVPTFWANVALKVGSRSAEECQEQHAFKQQAGQRSRKRTKTKKNEPMEEAVKEAPVITAKAGTLKRRQQIRNVLDQLPKDGYDDAFASSPMQKRLNMASTKMLSMADDEDHPLSLPMTPKTPQSFMLAGVKTPKCLHISPGMIPSLNRANDDKYAFRCQNDLKRRGGKGSAKPKNKENYIPTPVKATQKTRVAEDESFVVWEMFDKAASPQDESDQDYYFTDDD